MTITAPPPSTGITAKTATTSGSGAATPANQTISTTNFMQLLSTEMSNQDPLQPMDPTATMTQLAQFSTLQQQSALTQTQSLATANSFLGTQVIVPGINGASAIQGIVTGIDSSAVNSGGQPQLIISGASQEYPMTSVSQVTFPSSSTPSGSGTGTTTSSVTPTPTPTANQ